MVENRQPRATQRTWLRRFLLWVIGCVLFALGACCVGVGGLSHYLWELERPHTPIYTQGFYRARTHPAVLAALGEPVTADSSVSGTYDADMRTGGADQTVTIRGPRGSGTLHCVVHGDGGRDWLVDVVEVETDAGQHIDVLGAQ